MMLPLASVAVRRRLAARAIQQQQRRSMASGPKPEWTGIDKTVRKVLPEDWQVAAAILTGYGSLVGIFKMRSAMKKTPPEPEVVPTSSGAQTTTGIPAVDSPDFEKWVESDAFTSLLESEDQLTALVADMK